MLARFVPWLGELRWLWITLLVVISSMSILLSLRGSGAATIELAARSIGFALQCLALVTALVAILDARKQFGRAPLGVAFGEWWEARPWGGKLGATLSGNITLDNAMASGTMYSWASTDPTAPNEVRLAALEQQMTTLHSLWKSDNKAVMERLNTVESGIKGLKADLRSSEAMARSQLEKFAVDGVAFTVAGILCAFLGSLLGAFAPEAGRLLAQ